MEKTISVTSDSAGQFIELCADAESGLVPMEVKLGLDSGFTLSGTPSINYTDPGSVNFLPGESYTWSARLTVPGLYDFRVEGQDAIGNHYFDHVAVLATDRTTLDGILQAKWQGMKTAMIAGDIEKAVSHFSWGMQDTFREIFTLTRDNLAQIAFDMQDIELIYQKNGTAEYRIRRDVIFKGRPETITFYIYFERGPDGIWRIRDF